MGGRKHMAVVDLIAKKRDGGQLNQDEIEYFIRAMTAGEIPDYQVSALLMAIYLRGMSSGETAALTIAMANSGESVRIGRIKGRRADKHSTGGVGDKTTLVAMPMAAAAGIRIAKMSGRGLGFTGGTIDKLHAIPGFNSTIPIDRLVDIVNRVGLCITEQTENLTPADKRLYALRDVTATVDSIPLIASSVMSKKIALGADDILLDVKVGRGAFVKTYERAVLLAKEMVAIGERAGKRTVALITDMDAPLGRNIGNALEVAEAVETLRGNGPSDLTELCRVICANMLFLARQGTYENCLDRARQTLEDQSALGKLIEMVKEQGGDSRVIYDTNVLPRATCEQRIRSPFEGYLSRTDAEKIGLASLHLGAARQRKDDPIDYGAGIVLKAKYGDYIKKGETLAVFYAGSDTLFERAEEKFLSGIAVSKEKPKARPLIYGTITRDHL